MLSFIHVVRVTISQGEGVFENRKVIRIAHNLTDPRVKYALERLGKKYQKFHPDVRINIQSIPKRAYEQWVTTQLMGGTAPDLIQILQRSGSWAVLAQQYLVALTPFVDENNHYNDGTALEGKSWRSTYIDEMEGGYFMHLLDYYAIPMTVDNTRIYYNKNLFKAATGSITPKNTFREWMEISRQIRTYGESQGESIYPIAVAKEDTLGQGANLFARYFTTLTGGMMERYDTQQSGHNASEYVYYGLHAGTFDLKNERIRAGFELVKELYQQCKPSFASDQSEDKRFLFIQQRAAMVPGNVRDYGLYLKLAEFEVGVFNFPQAGRNDPIYGKYYAGPAPESALSTFSFGLTAGSQNQDLALDFLKFCTSQENNESFNTELIWYPAIVGSSLKDHLKIFKPNTEGVMLYPQIHGLTGYPGLFFEQNLPLYLSGQITFDTFMNQLTKVWFGFLEEVMAKKFAISLLNRDQTEFNVASSKAEMLFQEGGQLQAGHIVGKRTPYQIGLEIGAMHDQFICRQLYQLKHIKIGDFLYPLFGEDETKKNAKNAR